MSKFEGLQLLAGLTASNEDNSALLMLCGSSEQNSRAGSAHKGLSKEEQERRERNGGVSTEEADVGIYNDVAEADESEGCTPHKAKAEETSATMASQHAIPSPPAPDSHGAPQHSAPYAQGRQGGTLINRRPDTAQKIRVRTARLMEELAEIDRFREMRTISNNTHYSSKYMQHEGAAHQRSGVGRSVSGSSKQRATASRGFDGNGSQLPPIAAPRANSRGLFSETLAQSRHSALLTGANSVSNPADNSRVGAAPSPPGSPNGQRSQTRGDGRAGFSSKESKIAGLVQQLTNKWGR